VIEGDIFLKDHDYMPDGALGRNIRLLRAGRQIAGVSTTCQRQAE
jgi:hypothetical protein